MPLSPIIPSGVSHVAVLASTATPTASVKTPTIPSGTTSPMVSSISPKTGVRAGGAEVTITGANLAGATVDFGKKAGSIVSDTADKIVVTSPAGVGAVSVTVTTADGTSTASSADTFTYTTLTGLPARPSIPSGHKVKV